MELTLYKIPVWIYMFFGFFIVFMAHLRHNSVLFPKQPLEYQSHYYSKLLRFNRGVIIYPNSVVGLGSSNLVIDLEK